MSQPSPATIPDDIDALKEIVNAQASELHSKSLLIEKLKLQLAMLRRSKFGNSSEALDQLEMLLGGMEARQAQLIDSGAHSETVDPIGQPKRKALPDHLPREEHRHRLERTDCASCGAPMRKLAEETREILDYVPGSFVVKRHICEKYACRDCGSIAEAPLHPCRLRKARRAQAYWRIS
jgi:hypothetical protein